MTMRAARAGRSSARRVPRDDLLLRAVALGIGGGTVNVQDLRHECGTPTFLPQAEQPEAGRMPRFATILGGVMVAYGTLITPLNN